MKCGKPVETMEQEYCQDCTKQKHIFDQGRDCGFRNNLFQEGFINLNFIIRDIMHKCLCRRDDEKIRGMDI